MSAPNIVNVSNINGKTAVASITTSATDIAANAAASGLVLKVNALYISNIDGTNAASVTVDLYRASVAYAIVSTVSIPANSTMDLISKAIYLEEGDSLRLTASADGDLQAVCSYESIS